MKPNIRHRKPVTGHDRSVKNLLRTGVRDGSDLWANVEENQLRGAAKASGSQSPRELQPDSPAVVLVMDDSRRPPHRTGRS